MSVRPKPEPEEPLNSHAGAANGTSPVAGGTSNREVEYAVTRRVEQVVSQPGSIRRIEVAIVVKKPWP